MSHVPAWAWIPPSSPLTNISPTIVISLKCLPAIIKTVSDIFTSVHLPAPHRETLWYSMPFCKWFSFQNIFGRELPAVVIFTLQPDSHQQNTRLFIARYHSLSDTYQQSHNVKQFQNYHPFIHGTWWGVNMMTLPTRLFTTTDSWVIPLFLAL